MKRMLFNATYAEELRVAAVEGQKLINFDIETSSKEQRRGNVYKGFVTRVEPSLEACFVDYGTDKQGFLPFKEIDYRYLPDINGQRNRDFSKLPLGTEMIVQVEKDERGNKGAALTTYVTLPGRYLVLMPNNSRAGGISRRIEGEEREELKSLMSQLDITQGMSVILRTAALGRVAEELQWDLTYLTRLWEMIVEASKEKGSFLIYLESSLVIRSIRDHFSPDVSEVLIDTEEVYSQARKFMSLVMPNYADRIKLYRDDVPLFSRFQIEHQIESAYSRTVSLPSGGVIVIDHTEALTAVDVNSAKANKGADIETTALQTNLEAAEEVARQLRLRDLGGLVVVDFIDMENPRNQRDLENHFKQQLGFDRARIQMGKLSKFGLLELSRQRLQASLDESSAITCPRCAGVGTIRGIESSALHLLRLVQEEVVKNSGQLSALHVQLPVDVATYLLNERRDDVAKLEARMKVRIVLIPNVHLNSPQYKVKKLAHDIYDSNFNKSSYNLVEVPEETLGYKSVGNKKPDQSSKVPVIQEVTHQKPAPVIEKKKKSIFSSLVEKISLLFASKPAPAPVKKGHRNNNDRPRRDFKARDSQSTERNNRNRDNNRDNNKDGSRNNKTRPVTVTPSNNKIQTVRPNNSLVNQAELPAKRNNAAKFDDENKRAQAVSHQIPVDEIKVLAASVNEEVRAVKTNHAKVEKPVVAAVQSNTKVPSRLAKIRNDQHKKPEDTGNDSTENKKKPIEVEAVKVLVTETEVKLSQVQEIVPVVEIAKPVVTKPEVIDLGGMELVVTNSNLANKSAPEVTLPPVKRYNEVERREKELDLTVVFEQVETHK